MPKFTLNIHTDGDAFHPTPYDELARILDEVAEKVRAGSEDLGWFQTILDANGNDVGRFAIKTDDDRPWVPDEVRAQQDARRRRPMQEILSDVKRRKRR